MTQGARLVPKAKKKINKGSINPKFITTLESFLFFFVVVGFFFLPCSRLNKYFMHFR